MHHVRRSRAAMLGILPPQKSRHSHPRLPALRHVPGRHHRKGFRRPRKLAASLRLLLLWFSHRERHRLETLWQHNPRRTRTPALGHASLQATRYLYIARRLPAVGGCQHGASRLVSTLQPAAVACQHFSFSRSEPCPAAHEEPLPAAVDSTLVGRLWDVLAEVRRSRRAQRGGGLTSGGRRPE